MGLALKKIDPSTVGDNVGLKHVKVEKSGALTPIEDWPGEPGAEAQVLGDRF